MTDRYRLIPTRGATRYATRHVHGTEREAIKAAHDLMIESGVPVLVAEAPERGTVRVLKTVGGSTRRRRR